MYFDVHEITERSTPVSSTLNITMITNTTDIPKQKQNLVIAIKNTTDT